MSGGVKVKHSRRLVHYIHTIYVFFIFSFLEKIGLIYPYSYMSFASSSDRAWDMVHTDTKNTPHCGHKSVDLHHIREQGNQPSFLAI